MDLGLYELLGIVLLWLAALAAAIAGTADTFQFEPIVWAEAGYARTSWMWQAAMVLFLPGALVYSGIYLLPGPSAAHGRGAPYRAVRPQLPAVGGPAALVQPLQPGATLSV